MYREIEGAPMEVPKKSEYRDINERTFQFACDVVRLYDWLHRRPGIGRSLAGQLFRCGTSVGANLEEARGGQSKADFISKTRIALKEARESHYWLRLLMETYATSRPRVEPLVTEANEIVAILTTILKHASPFRKPPH
jgi:four helix bundle protein